MWLKHSLWQVWRHRIGSDAEQDEVVFHEKDEQFYVNLGKSRDEKILIIQVGNALSSACPYPCQSTMYRLHMRR